MCLLLVEVSASSGYKANTLELFWQTESGVNRGKAGVMGYEEGVIVGLLP